MNIHQIGRVHLLADVAVNASFLGKSGSDDTVYEVKALACLKY